MRSLIIAPELINDTQAFEAKATLVGSKGGMGPPFVTVSVRSNL